MACFWTNHQECTVDIPGYEEINSITYYNIKVKVADISWSVSRRYRDFFELHTHLVIDHGVAKESLPPKKVIGNKEPKFIEKRRNGLEKYLQQLLCYLKRTMPKLFVEFLHFNVYDSYFLLQYLALKVCSEVDAQTTKYELSPIQLHSISESLKHSFPGFEQNDTRYDISHVLDFCCRLTSLTVEGREENYLSSNIIQTNLKFDFNAFKILEKLKVLFHPMESVLSVGTLRSTLKTLVVSKSQIATIAQVLQCDVLHKTNIDLSHVWTKLHTLDLSKNNLEFIDESIKLAPNLINLILSNNEIKRLDNISLLTNLRYINLSKNLIIHADDLHTKLGNLVTLDLSHNKIYTLKGFSKLYSLESLYVSFNSIEDVNEVWFVGHLPCLTNFMLGGNPLSTIVDYRVRVLECFGKNARNITLDNDLPSQSELDKVQVLNALRIVKEGKVPNLHRNACQFE